ncbi:MAG TPA: SBBP repeat-containing protein [Patescibacteria group bacterium]|nr:SBBP repeat-containing protein [Patescibacteria group bacterium]
MKNLQRILFCAVLLLSFTSFKGSAQTPEWEWAKSAGGLYSDEGNSIAVDSFGNTYTLGSYCSETITFDSITLTNSTYGGNGHNDIFLVKHNPQGKLVWAKTAGGIGSERRQDIGREVKIDKQGYIYIIGDCSGPIAFDSTIVYGEGDNVIIVKYTPDGEMLWGKSFGGYNTEMGMSISLDNESNIYFTGVHTSLKFPIGKDTLKADGFAQMMVIKLDSTGEVIWSKSFGGSRHDIGFSIAADSHGNVYIGGGFDSDSISFGETTLYHPPLTRHRVFFVKFDTNGNILWARGGGQLSVDGWVHVATDDNGNLIAHGDFIGTSTTFENITLPNTRQDSSDIFLVKYDTDGNLLWAQSAGGTQKDVAGNLTIDVFGNILIAGLFSSPAITFGTTVLQNVGGQDMFIAKFDPTGNVLWATSNGSIGNEKINSIAESTTGDLYVTGIFQSGTLTLATTTLKSNGREDIFIAKLHPATTSITEKIKNTQISIFPNPTASQFHITVPEPGNWTITIYTLDGQSVFKKELIESNSMIDLSGKAKGAYVYRLLKDGEVFKTGKLVLE